MRVLITENQSKFGSRLAATLARYHDIQPLDVGDTLHREQAKAAVEGCDAVVFVVSASESPLVTLDLATRGVYNLAISAAPATQFVLLGSLNFLEAYPPECAVTELWEPRPTSAIDSLAPYLAERTAREVIRDRGMVGIALRMGTIVDAEDMRARPPDPRWLHIDDAIQAVERAVVWKPKADGPLTGFWIFNIVGGGKYTRFPLAAAGRLLGYAPQHTLSSGIAQGPAPQPERHAPESRGSLVRAIVIFGAAGQLTSRVAPDLGQDHTLRLTDILPLDAAGARGYPALPPPHEIRAADVTDPDQVLDAARGMDAILNCTVSRHDPVESFRVNVLGAYNVARAAVACGIRRIAHTGSLPSAEAYPSGYWHDFRLSADDPPRPGVSLYNITKNLGYEVLRIFAEEYDLEIPVLCFNGFIDPSQPVKPPGPDRHAYHPLDYDSVAYCHAVSWDDAAQAIRLAFHAPSLPRPFEMMHILADLPHGRYSNAKAKRLLGWQPRDRLEPYWQRDLS